MSQGMTTESAGGDDNFGLPSLTAAAHELKAPLAVMRQLALTIQEGAASPDEVVKLAERINLTSERALRLTSDLTRGSQLDTSLFELEPLDVTALCLEVVRELEPLYQARGRQLIATRRQRGLPLAVAHRDLLRRIMVNFADNALRYAQPDQPVELFTSYRRNQDQIRLGVRDYGPSVARNFVKSLNRPAKPAYRPDSSGLGLYLATQFAMAMNARVGVVQHRDGASFYVDIARSSQMRLW